MMGTTSSGWRSAHEELCELSRRRGELDWLEAGALLRALRANVHRHLGFGSFAEYVERLFGYGRRAVDDKLRLALALEELPLLSQALRGGGVSASAARELSRVATPETEKEWLEAAQGRTVHQVERMVSGRSRGDRPTDAADPAKRRHVLRFEVSAETLAHVREAFAKMRSRSEGRLDDDALLLLMAREVLAGPTDDGRASYQVAITTCEHCRRGFQQAAGELIEVADEIVEMAGCDAQQLGHVGATREPVSSKQVASHEGRQVQRPAHGGSEEVDRQAQQATHVGPVHQQARQGTHVGSELGHLPAPAAASADRMQRATQAIPPALRRKVMRRDHGRCVVPGCEHYRFVDLHHIQARAEGGKHDENNLVVVCSAHHRALHHRKLWLEGSVATGLSFRHADGRAYGENRWAQAADQHERAFRGLRNLGFSFALVSRALERARAELGGRPHDTEGLMRAALRILVPGATPPVRVAAS